MKNLNKKYLLIILIILSVIVLIGTSYGLLRSSQIGENSYVMNVGLLEVSFLDSETNALNVSNMVPSTDEEGMSTNEELVFTVKNTGTIDAKYNVYIEETTTSPEFKTVIRHISNKNDKGYNSPKTLSDNNFIDTLGELKVGETATYKVKVWLAESADSTYMNQEFKARVVVEAIQGDAPASYFLQKSINESTCNPIVVEDGITYLSGDNKCINFNYVWYSGKLWRITAIYPDGSMKMITEDVMTTINWGEKATISDTDLTSAYSTSWVREWLNQEFLPTLYNYENIIDVDAGWYSITDSNSTPTKPTSDYTLTDPVGLLNAYEYYMSYKNTSSSNGYLNVGYVWLLNTPYNASNVRYVSDNGGLGYGSASENARSVRPVVKLLPTLEFIGGNGTINNPYKINGDFQTIEPNVTLLNARISGEYVRLETDSNENRLFRIVNMENSTTKLVLNDYVKDINDLDGDLDTTESLTKLFSENTTDVLWSSLSETNETYWKGYLNNTWLTQLDSTYNGETKTSDLLEQGIYYLGTYPRGVSYKQVVCKTVYSNKSIQDCIDENTGENETVQPNTLSYVGLLRIGEMFSSQPKEYDSNNAIPSWLITPFDSKYVRGVDNDGYGIYYTGNLGNYVVRPTINLTSSVVIKSGSGTEQDPFVVGLPTT